MQSAGVSLDLSPTLTLSLDVNLNVFGILIASLAMFARASAAWRSQIPVILLHVDLEQPVPSTLEATQSVAVNLDSFLSLIQLLDVVQSV